MRVRVTRVSARARACVSVSASKGRGETSKEIKLHFISGFFSRVILC